MSKSKRKAEDSEVAAVSEDEAQPQKRGKGRPPKKTRTNLMNDDGTFKDGRRRLTDEERAEREASKKPSGVGSGRPRLTDEERAEREANKKPPSGLPRGRPKGSLGKKAKRRSNN